MDDEQYQQDIDAVEIFLVEEIDINVIFGDDEPNAYWQPNGHACVSIATNQRKRLQLYSLLHEAGHAIIRAKERYDTLYPYGPKPVIENKTIALFIGNNIQEGSLDTENSLVEIENHSCTIKWEIHFVTLVNCKFIVVTT